MKPFGSNHMIEAAKTKRGLSLPLECAVFVAVYVVGALLRTLLVSAADAFVLLFTGAFLPTDIYILLTLLCSVVITVTVILFCIKQQARDLTSLGLDVKQLIPEYAVGAVLGVGLLFATLLVCELLLPVQYTVHFVSTELWMLYLLGFLVQGMSEEVLCRGYLMPSMARAHSLPVAVIGNSLLFALLHLGNQGITLVALLNIILFGILMSVYVLKRGNLWGACAIHSLWNFAQGNLFGLPVSGLSTLPSPIVALFPESHPLIHGGSFGPEGGLATTAVLTLALMATMVFMKPAKNDKS